MTVKKLLKYYDGYYNIIKNGFFDDDIICTHDSSAGEYNKIKNKKVLFFHSDNFILNIYIK